MDIYVDTCIISGYVKQDMKSSDMIAFAKIMNIAESGKISIHSSTMALQEINQIPEKWQTEHVTQYETISKVKGSTSSWLDLETSTDENAVEYQTLRDTLKDENDAKHLYLAKQAGISTFITVDEKTLLSKATELQSHCNIEVCSPSQYMLKISDTDMYP